MTGPTRAPYSAWFQPIDGAAERYPLNEVIYRSPKSGALLEVVHDEAALRQQSAAAWRQLFDGRYGRTAWPYGSGVWSKHEWVQPHVEPHNVVSLYEGNSNLFWAERYGRSIGLEDLWVKQCGISHTGSFKDLGMTVLVSSVKQMIAEGNAIRALACASTGDTSAALAAYGAAAGIPVVVILPKGKISAAQLIQPLANGAIVCSLDTDFDGCMRVVQELTHEPTIYLANSMNSLRVEGQKTIAAEIVQQFDWEVPDWVLVPGGNLGNISAIAKGFIQMQRLGVTDRLPRIACCQAEQANPLYQAFRRAKRQGRPLRPADLEPQVAGETMASAIRIGNPVSFAKAVSAIGDCDGVVEQASEAELAAAAAKADLTGMYNCPHTGVALACLEKLRQAQTIGPRDRVVVISTAHGLKFSEFKTRYHTRGVDFPAAHANTPIEMEGAPAAVLPAIQRALDQRTRAR